MIRPHSNVFVEYETSHRTLYEKVAVVVVVEFRGIPDTFKCTMSKYAKADTSFGQLFWREILQFVTEHETWEAVGVNMSY